MTNRHHDYGLQTEGVDMHKGQMIKARNSEWRRAWAHVLSILLLCVCGLVSPHAETLNGKVTQVADGDTLTIVGENKQAIKIRLAGIDSPEKAQVFGQRSK